MQTKIKSFKRLCKITEELKKKNKRIVLVHGFFDILHKGHVTLLHNAKELGDILIVGIDHDENARIIKGPNRPINDHYSRMLVVSSIEDVDFVFLIPSFKDEVLKDKNLDNFFSEIYRKLNLDIIATCTKAGKHAFWKRRHAKLVGIKFVDIKHQFSNVHTNGFIKF